MRFNITKHIAENSRIRHGVIGIATQLYYAERLLHLQRVTAICFVRMCFHRASGRFIFKYDTHP